MQFKVAAILAFALTAYAAPQVTDGTGDANGEGNAGDIGVVPGYPGDTTIQEAGDACGTNMSLSCCNQYDISGDSVNEASGLLSGALEGALPKGLGLFNGCSKLQVPIGILGVGASDLLNSQCKQTAACCQHSGTSQSGLVNVGLPCVALGGLL